MIHMRLVALEAHVEGARSESFHVNEVQDDESQSHIEQVTKLEFCLRLSRVPEVVHDRCDRKTSGQRFSHAGVHRVNDVVGLRSIPIEKLGLVVVRPH